MKPSRSNHVKILIEPSGYALTNMGDIAMLAVGVNRIKALLPQSELSIVTTAPDRLGKLFPGTHPVDAHHFASWRYLKVLPVSHRFLGLRLKQQLEALDGKLRFAFPETARAMIRFNARVAGHGIPGVDNFWNVVQQSNAIIATGGGYFTDSFLFMANGVIETLRLAQGKSKPFALFGQGLGPLTDQAVKAKFGKIIRNAAVIGLREGIKGPDFLKGFNVNPAHITITGDDAIELAFNENLETGLALGFNIRATDYSGISDGQLAFFHKMLPGLAAELDSPILSLPIETKPKDADQPAIQKAIPSGFLANATFSPNEPADIIREVGKCRVVITASYHAGVFALAQGIPVIALVRSEYYRDKFLGLRNQFGEGMGIINLDEVEAPQYFRASLRTMWTRAEDYRKSLLASAKIQIEKSRQAYRAFFSKFQ